MASPQQLSDSKRKLLQMYLKGEAARQSREAVLTPREPGTMVPLAPSQQQVWLHAQMAPELPVYNEPITIHYRGTLNRVALEQSFREILRRHEIWRTTFANIDGQVMQVVHDSLKVAIPFNDLSAFPEVQREEEAHRLATADAKRPFDMAVGPLLRVRLIQMTPETHRLHLTLHHIIFDGVTLYRTLLPELAALYESFSQGLPSPLSEPKLQYADYALWQRRYLENDSAARQLQYWKCQLAGELPNLELPTDRPRPAVPSHRGAMEKFAFPAEMIEAIKQRSRDEGVTLYMLLLASFKALLFRYSGQEDILVGGVTDGRGRSEFEPLMGFFLNTLVMRSRPAAVVPFRDYLGQVKDTVLGALGASEVPFDRLVRELQPKRDTSRHPLFQVLFSIQPPAAPPPASPDDAHWDLTQMDISAGTSKFDLYVELEERPEGLIGRIMYSSDLFDASTIRRMIGHWLKLIEGAIQSPQTTLGDLPLLTEQEDRQIRFDWNRTQRSVSECPVHELFEEQAARTPNAIALESDGRYLTFRELNQEANRLARRLLEAGAGPDKLVALSMERSCDMVVGLLGILKSGAAYLPLDPYLPEERMAFILEDSQAGIVVAGADVKLPLTKAILVEAHEGTGSGSNLRIPVETSRLAYVLYTSGSTGRPKGVEIPHSALVNFLESMRREPGFTSGDALLAVTTLSFDIAGLEIFLPLITGGRLVVASQATILEPERLLRLMKDSGANVMQATPALWRALVDAGWRGNRGLKALCGGEALSRDLAESLIGRCGELWNLYGPTETTIWSTIHKVSSSSGPVSIGHPIANTQTYVLDKEQHLVPAGVAGELYIGGQGLARCYRGRPELTAEKFVPAPALQESRLYRTGDLARWRADGTLECLGRADNQLKIRGFRIEPEEIESILAEHPQVRAAGVRAWPDGSGNLSLAAYVVASGEPALRSFLRERLPDYMVPAHFVFLPALPLTPNGKLDRKALPQPDLTQPRDKVQRDSFAAPMDNIERRLAAVWEAVLDVRPIGRNDDFFNLGGHSLLVAKLLRRIETEFGTRLSMANLFQAPTLDALAEILRGQPKPEAITRVAPIQSSGSRTPLFWINAGPLFRPLAAHLGVERPFYGVALQPDQEARLPHNPSISQIAAHLVETIRATQPEGPYLLGGRCASGLVAYEIAQQLTAEGQEVELLALLDCRHPKRFLAIPRQRMLASRFRYHKSKLGDLPASGIWSYLRSRFTAFLNRHRPTEDLADQEGYLNLIQAAYTYEPRPYVGRTVFFEPSDRLDIDDMASNWDGVTTGDATIEVVAGDHDSVLSETNVPWLAARLQGHLNHISSHSKAGRADVAYASGFRAGL